MTLPSSDERLPHHPKGEFRVADGSFRVPRAWESWFLGVVAGCAVFVLTFAVQWFVYDYLMGDVEFHFVGVAVASLLTFIFIQRMMSYSRQRRIATLRRFQVIAEVNHHIRNSLQTILYQSYTLDDEVATRLKDAADRIQWVLDRVLPAMQDDGGKRRKPPDDSSERAA